MVVAGTDKVQLLNLERRGRDVEGTEEERGSASEGNANVRPYNPGIHLCRRDTAQTLQPQLLEKERRRRGRCTSTLACLMGGFQEEVERRN
ncbi:hypothetical protein CgunFtcFv8_018150 [Champsocephalus gunnari]|uniref:Uncharacterized protein n=1 Tax=Champsocephalus gunnari TaxID=52237 RepID=A0AAN8DP32_CHAGU|nr:hypothetical protein CgunFtcFv8_018149 [Champsocephalus gunnari]KAK5925641.1 hypothetical protein CgunFtcFv8_018150 [Champsocephalus gunnari]